MRRSEVRKTLDSRASARAKRAKRLGQNVVPTIEPPVIEKIIASKPVKKTSVKKKSKKKEN